MSGRVHIYCGDGKGKTSAAIGLAVRAAGRGCRVTLMRAMKDNDSGEVLLLSSIPQVYIIDTPKELKFIWLMDEDEKREYSALLSSMLTEARRRIAAGEADMLVIDEAMSAVSTGLLPEEELLDLIRTRPEGLEIVLTGRDPTPAVLAEADYVTEMKKIRHPYDSGQDARSGIEF